MAKKSMGRRSSAKRTTVRAKSRETMSGRKRSTATKTSSGKESVKKHVGDVLGISRARVSKSVPSGGRRPKGIEITRPRRTGLKRATVVGGVRGRGR